MATKATITGGYLPPSDAAPAASVRLRLSGNRAAAEAFARANIRGWVAAINQAAEFQGLSTAQRVVSLPTGETAVIKKVFGTVTVDVFAPPPVQTIIETPTRNNQVPILVARVKLALGRPGIDAAYALTWLASGSTEDLFLYWDVAAGQPLEVTGWTYPVTQAEIDGEFGAALLQSYTPSLPITAAATLITRQAAAASPLMVSYPLYSHWGEFFDAPIRTNMEALLAPLLSAPDYPAVDATESATLISAESAQLNTWGTTDSVAVGGSLNSISSGYIIYYPYVYEPHNPVVVQDYIRNTDDTRTIVWTDVVTAPSGGFCVPISLLDADVISVEISPSYKLDDCWLRCENASGAADYPWGAAGEWAGSGSYVGRLETYVEMHQTVEFRERSYPSLPQLEPGGDVGGMWYWVVNGDGALAAWTAGPYVTWDFPVVAVGEYGSSDFGPIWCNPGYYWFYSVVISFSSVITGAHTITSSYTGAGTITTPTGAGYPISVDMSVHKATAAPAGDDNVNAPYNTWTATLAQDTKYLFRAVDVTGAYSVPLRYQMTIVTESISHGTMSTAGAATEATAGTGTWRERLNESAAVVVAAEDDYLITAKVGVFPNLVGETADTASPWALNRDTALETALGAMITDAIGRWPSPASVYPGSAAEIEQYNFWKAVFSIEEGQFILLPSE